jgi:uncharacterized protein (TIGR02594 family)
VDQPTKPDDIRKAIIKTARAEIGQKEIKGKKHNPSIVRYWKAVNNAKGITDDETPWCAAFVNFVLLETGLSGTGKANARSFLTWGRSTSNPQPGDIVVFWRGAKDGWQGHVGFYMGFEGNYIKVLGGNQTDQVKISTYSRDKLLGYRSAV